MPSFDCNWPTGPTSCKLPLDAIHVWCISINLSQQTCDHLISRLSADERQRADEFARDEPRNRFIVSRCRSREILANYLDCRPEEIRFRYGDHGKPELNAPWSDSGLQFNLTKSKDIALIAVTHQRIIGVDVERVRTVPDHVQIAQRYFSRGEQEQLQNMPPDQQLPGFFRCWTLKEAVLKALGTGLTTPLDSIEVSFDPDESVKLLAAPGSPDEQDPWSLALLAPAAGYIAALACRGDTQDNYCWIWPE